MLLICHFHTINKICNMKKKKILECLGILSLWLRMISETTGKRFRIQSQPVLGSLCNKEKAKSDCASKCHCFHLLRKDLASRHFYDGK